MHEDILNGRLSALRGRRRLLRWLLGRRLFNGVQFQEAEKEILVRILLVDGLLAERDGLVVGEADHLVDAGLRVLAHYGRRGHAELVLQLERPIKVLPENALHGEP